MPVAFRVHTNIHLDCCKVLWGPMGFHPADTPQTYDYSIRRATARSPRAAGTKQGSRRGTRSRRGVCTPPVSLYLAVRLHFAVLMRQMHLVLPLYLAVQLHFGVLMRQMHLVLPLYLAVRLRLQFAVLLYSRCISQFGNHFASFG